MSNFRYVENVSFSYSHSSIRNTISSLFEEVWICAIADSQLRWHVPHCGILRCFSLVPTSTLEKFMVTTLKTTSRMKISLIGGQTNTVSTPSTMLALQEVDYTEKTSSGQSNSRDPSGPTYLYVDNAFRGHHQNVLHLHNAVGHAIQLMRNYGWRKWILVLNQLGMIHGDHP